MRFRAACEIATRRAEARAGCRAVAARQKLQKTPRRDRQTGAGEPFVIIRHVLLAFGQPTAVVPMPGLLRRSSSVECAAATGALAALALYFRHRPQKRKKHLSPLNQSLSFSQVLQTFVGVRIVLHSWRQRW